MEDIIFKIWNLSANVQDGIQNKNGMELLEVRHQLIDMIPRGEHLQTDLTRNFANMNSSDGSGSQEQYVNFSHIISYVDDVIASVGSKSKKPKFGKSKSCLELIWFARIAMDNILKRSMLKSVSKAELNIFNCQLYALKEKLNSVYKKCGDKISQREKNSFYEIIDEIDYNREKRFGFEVCEESDYESLTSQY